MSQHLLWAKPGFEVNQAIQDFLAGGDIVHDRELFVGDISKLECFQFRHL